MKENNYAFVSIVAIVAIVAMITLFTGNRIVGQQENSVSEYRSMDKQNIGGQAAQYTNQATAKEVFQIVPGALAPQEGYCQCSDTLQARCTIDGRVTDCKYCCEEAEEMINQES